MPFLIFWLHSGGATQFKVLQRSNGVTFEAISRFVWQVQELVSRNNRFMRKLHYFGLAGSCGAR